MAGNVDVYNISMTHTHSTGVAFSNQVVHWEVAIVVPQAQVADLQTYYASNGFEGLLDASHLGPTHSNSLLSPSGALTVAAASARTAVAPSPPAP